MCNTLILQRKLKISNMGYIMSFLLLFNVYCLSIATVEN